MLASLTDAPLDDPQFVYEPKYDGIRAIVEIDAAGGVRIWSRLGNEKTKQFPEIAKALEAWARRRKTRQPVVLDGEIVALNAAGEPGGFQQLQGRIHLAEGGGGRTALIAFDILRRVAPTCAVCRCTNAAPCSSVCSRARQPEPAGRCFD